VLSFWIVAGIYLMHISYSLVEGMFTWRELTEGRAFHRFIARGPSNQQINEYVNLHAFNYSRFFAPTMSVAAVLLLALGARLAVGSWNNLGKVLKNVQHPFHATLGLVFFGFFITISPAFLAGLLSQDLSVHTIIWAPPDGLNGRAILNGALGSIMVLLAGRVEGSALEK
jgi:hypothetical protein